MGRKLDMSNLTEEEVGHVLQVVQRDMQLRKTEEERLSELKQELDQEESRCVLLSRQCGFNERCCIRCCTSFTFFLKPRRRCLDCRYNVCKRCCSYSETDKSWLCFACEKSRLLKTQSLEWFYSNVRRRFKRFGSAKVLKMLYRRHIGDQGSQAEFTEGSTYAESTDDSVYESDSTFYKHTEERSMAESISVALRVAKEAIDEAITKAEKQPGNQEKLKEACYLRDNRGELIEELTTMILQTIICKSRDLSEMHTECNLETPPDQNSNSQSASSLLTDEILAQHNRTEQSSMHCKQGLKKDEVPAVASWNQNMDWMENSCASSVLQSPDGNWFALQSTQMPTLSLPTKRENLMFSALEKESGVISAYDGMASDTESDSDGAWGAARGRKLCTSYLLNDHHATGPKPAIKISTKYTSDQPQSDSDQNNPVPQINSPSLPLLKRKVSLENRYRPCQCHSAMGVTTNPYGGESSEDGLEDNRVKRTRRRRRHKREATEGNSLRVCSGERLSLSEPQDYGRMLLNYLLKCQSKRQSVSEFPSDETVNADTPDSVTPDILKSGAMTPDAFTPDAEDPTTEHHVLNSTSDQQLTSKLRELANHANGTQLSLTRNGLDGVEEPVDREREKKEERDKEKREELSDMEVNVGQKVSELKEEKDQNVGNRLIDVEDNERENKKLKNSETQSTNMIDNLHNEETVEKQSAPEIERTTRMSLEEPKEHRQRELYSTYNTDSERQIKTNEDEANYLSERTHEDQNAEQGKKDRSECTQGDDTESEPVKNQDSIKSKKHIELQAKCLSETPVEICGKREKDESQECRKQKKDTEYEAENKKDNTGSEHRMNKEKESIRYDNLDLGELGKSKYKQMTENVVTGLNIMEEEAEAQICNTTYSISDFTDDYCKEKEVIMGKQNEQTQESDMENESRSNFVGKTEEQICVADAEECNVHTLKDILDCTTSGQEGFLSPEEVYKKYSAASLRSITTEVLKVLNATEDLIQGAMGLSQSESWHRPSLPPTQSRRLDEQLSRIEENVYVAASAVFGLEAELGDLEECARSISGDTTEEELSQLEEQVASAAAQVKQSELQVTDIAARIAALKNAGLNVAPQTRFAKPQTIDSSRQHRRRLPAPPMQGKKT